MSAHPVTKDYSANNCVLENDVIDNSVVGKYASEDSETFCMEPSSKGATVLGNNV